MVELATTLGEYPETTVDDIHNDDIHNDDILRVQVSHGRAGHNTRGISGNDRRRHT